MSELPITAVAVGSRFRQELGDIAPLKKSIAAVGLLHPIVVRGDGTLVAGARRLEAVRQLGWETVPVTIADSLDTAQALLTAERDENTCRLDMKPSEKVALGRELEKLERPRAAEAQGTRTDLLLGDSPKSERSPVRTRERVSKSIDMGDQTYYRAKKVVEAAEAGIPEAQEALREMDETGNVSAAFKKASGKPQTERQTQIKARAKDRFWEFVSGLDGYRAGLRDFPFERAIAGATAEDIAAWIKSLKEAKKTIGQLISTLEGGASE